MAAIVPNHDQLSRDPDPRVSDSIDEKKDEEKALDVPDIGVDGVMSHGQGIVVDGVPFEDLPWWKQRKINTGGNSDPFADEEGADVQYKTMKWWQASMVMIAETISLGILSLPSVLKTIGLVPGVILILGLGVLATYSGYILWEFKMRYPHEHNMADACEILWGRVGREIGGAAQIIFLVFTMASHVLTFTIALNVMTEHVTCTIIWSVVGTVLLFLLSLPRTLKNVSYLSIVSFISVTSAVVITMAGVGISPPPGATKPVLTVAAPFASAFLSVSNIIFAYAGHVAFFSFIAELKDPKDFPKALFLLQSIDISLYVLIAVLVYCYAGDATTSPALGTAGRVVERIAYGIAMPTILIAGVIYAHVASKYVYVRLFRGTTHMSKRTPLAVGSWIGITALWWLLAWAIAESIPNFNSLLALISSLFASWFTYGLPGIFWLHLNRGKLGKKFALTALNWLLVLIGGGIMIMGLYASGKAIHDEPGASWTCADNSKMP